MREGVQMWLSGQQPAGAYHPSGGGAGGRAADFGMGALLHGGAGGDAFFGLGGVPLPPLLPAAPLPPGAYPPGLSSAALDKLAYMAVKRAVATMEAAAVRGEEFISQVGECGKRGRKASGWSIH